MNRIESIYNHIDNEDKVVDVGCDQAKLSLMLAKRNQPSIACDISENVINKAKKTINNPLIDLRVSNGLENIKYNEADTLVLSGMGTHTIIEILSNTELLFNKIITISNNYHDILRIKMNNLGYMVDYEEIIKENNKYYNLIDIKKEKYNYNERELLLGMNHINTSLYHEYLNFLINNYKKIKEKSNNKNVKINKLIELIETTLNK